MRESVYCPFSWFQVRFSLKKSKNSFYVRTHTFPKTIVFKQPIRTFISRTSVQCSVSVNNYSQRKINITSLGALYFGSALIFVFCKVLSPNGQFSSIIHQKLQSGLSGATNSWNTRTCKRHTKDTNYILKYTFRCLMGMTWINNHTSDDRTLDAYGSVTDYLPCPALLR
jgi:hypothetical protein